MEGFREIGFVILALIFVENASAQTFSFPEETMLSVLNASLISPRKMDNPSPTRRDLQGSWLVP